jgi:hypothetical protein
MENYNINLYFVGRQHVTRWLASNLDKIKKNPGWVRENYTVLLLDAVQLAIELDNQIVDNHLPEDVIFRGMVAELAANGYKLL